MAQTIQSAALDTKTASDNPPCPPSQDPNHPFFTRLPFELLGYIFEIACWPKLSSEDGRLKYSSVFKCRETRLAVGSSCMHFRRVLLSTPAAWSHVPLLIDRGWTSNTLGGVRSVVPLEISRGAMSPVHLYAFLQKAPPEEGASYEEFLRRSLQSVQSRVATLFIDVDGSCPTLPPLSFLSIECALPALTWLHISTRITPLISKLDIRGAPALKKLSIKYKSAKFHSPPLTVMHNSHSFIDELVLRGEISVRDSMGILSSCHQSIDTFRWVLPARNGTSGDLPSLHTTLQLPRLRDLTLQVPAPLSFLTPSQYSTPSVELLGIRNWSHGTVDEETARMAIIPSLHACALVGTEMKYPALKALLRANPSIRTIKALALVQDVTTFFSMADAAPEGEILPNLEQIHFFEDERETREAFVSLFLLIRARKHGFRACFHSSPGDFGEGLLAEYGDVMVLDYNCSSMLYANI
ncbi:hypothetical protein DL93DRAFT_2230299 [Clavulina sp. PMI_390]|nr:hypothetical protein DL93DRAFT_2230299 [Clavulina sp. PMI_390]